MSINAKVFYNQKTLQFDAESSQAAFSTNYKIAVNRTLSRLGIVLDTDSPPDLITNLQAPIDLDERYEYILSLGVDYWLVRAGHRSGDLDLKQAELNYEDAIKDILLARDLEATRDATDNETIGVIDTD